MENEIASGVSTEADVKKSSVRMIVVSALVLLVLVAIGAYVYSTQKKGPQESERPAILDSGIKKTELAQGSVSNMFPTDLPVEKGVKVLETAEYQSREGARQGTLRYISEKPIEQNYSLYLNYMKSTGWNVVNEDNGDTQKLLRGKKSGQVLQIDFIPEDLKGSQTIALYLTQN